MLWKWVMAVGVMALSISACSSSPPSNANSAPDTQSPYFVVDENGNSTPRASRPPGLVMSQEELDLLGCNAIGEMSLWGKASSARLVATTGAAINALGINESGNAPAVVTFGPDQEVILAQVTGSFTRQRVDGGRANSNGGAWPPREFTTGLVFLAADGLPLSILRDGGQFQSTQPGDSIANQDALGKVTIVPANRCDDMIQP